MQVYSLRLTLTMSYIYIDTVIGVQKSSCAGYAGIVDNDHQSVLVVLVFHKMNVMVASLYTYCYTH